MKFKIETIGCKVNFAESEKILGDFLKKGFTQVSGKEHADIIFVNTCTVTNKAESDARRLIRKLKRENPSAKIIVGGCMVEFNSEDVSQIEEVDFSLGQSAKYQVSELLDNFTFKTSTEKPTNDLSKFISASSTDPENRSRAFLKLQDGCDYFCSYCAIPYARGEARSMDFDEVLPAIKSIREKGFRELVISGINLGTYHSKGKNFFNLLHEIEQSNFDIRIRISSIEPNLLTDEIIDLIATSKIFCPHFHIPLQSGSDSILKQMNRRYNTALFSERINKIITSIPNCAIGIDVICGFPGETDELFEETYNYLKKMDFSYLHVFTYSERKNTPANSMQGAVKHHIRKERTKILRELSDRKKELFYNKFIGNSYLVVQEYSEKKTHSFGWTPNYIRVKYPADIKYDGLISVKLLEQKDGYVLSEIEQ